MRLFTGSARDRIAARLEARTRYEPMIRAAMRGGGIPEDMYYLALVESGFDPNAYSRAAAVGMWQFMTSTARDMGMRVDWWVDERRDPVKSTTAAVRFIKGLREHAPARSADDGRLPIRAAWPRARREGRVQPVPAVDRGRRVTGRTLTIMTTAPTLADVTAALDRRYDRRRRLDAPSGLVSGNTAPVCAACSSRWTRCRRSWTRPCASAPT